MADDRKDPPSAEQIPGQTQDRMPAYESPMEPAPDYEPRHPGVGKLKGKVALVTGGDSGIGRAVAVLFAREGARVVIAYLDEHEDAEETRRLVEREGSEARLIAGDLAHRAQCAKAVEAALEGFGQIDILVNNAAQQFMDAPIEDLDEETLRRMIDSNIMAVVHLTQAALPHLKEGSSIINTTSVNAFKGNGGLAIYSTTRGAVLAFTRSIAQQVTDRGIRVNAVAPGPIWTPFIPGTMSEEKVEGFGSQVPLNRPGQPWEVATSYLFLASSDGNYFHGQTLHPNGGAIVGA